LIDNQFPQNIPTTKHIKINHLPTVLVITDLSVFVVAYGHFLIAAGTEYMGGTGGHVPPNFWTGGDIISFVPLTFCDEN